MSSERETRSSGGGKGLAALLIMGGAFAAYKLGLIQITPASGDTHLGSVPPGSNDMSWLLTTNSNGGHVAYDFHNNQPQGNTCNGGDNVPISSVADHHVLGAPTVSCQEFVDVLKNADSPAYTDGVAAEMWGKAVVDGVDPAFILGLFKAESSYGTDANWGAKGTMNVGNEEFNPHLDNPHGPGYHEYTNPNSGYHYMDYSGFGPEGWAVGVGYTDGWLGWAAQNYHSNSAVDLVRHWAGSNGDTRNVLAVMNSVRGK